MKSVVKIVYPQNKLKLATENGYEKIELYRGKELDLELVDERRCVGFHSDRGEMNPCPDFREIESGDQCTECRKKDIYTGWRQGSSSPDFEANYSVYLAQCGTEVKIGVAKSGRLQNRWKEQGADFAAEIETGLSGEETLEIEEEISSLGIAERLRKEKKIREADSRKLKEVMEEFDYEASIEQVYADGLRCRKVARSGKIPSPIKYVKGQIVSNGRIGMAMTSGKCLVEKRQQGLEDF